jgi:hypothetical protein
VPDVSFVVPLYGKAGFLPYLLDGIAAQEGSFTREVILVDDGSPDDSLAVARRLTAGWSHTTIIAQANAGPSAALATGLAAARGRYVKPLDCDDMLLPWATARLLDAAVATGAAIAYAPPGSQPGLTPGDTLPPVPRPPEVPPVSHDLLPAALRKAQTQPSVWLAPRAVLAEAGSDLRVFVQDYALELRLAAHGPAARLDIPLVRIGRHPGQLSGNEAQVLHDVNAALLHFLAERPGLPGRLRRYALRRAAGRAWGWAGRHGPRRSWPGALANLLRARLGLAPDEAALLAPFLASGRVRIPVGPAASAPAPR